MLNRSRLPWDTSHDTLQVLRRRRREESKPGARAADDHARVALLVNGGGMRGVISAAMLCALDDLGYKNAIDIVYGYSAGAINAAYFIAGEMWYPLSIYYDHLASTTFVNFRRSLRRRPIMSMSFASDIVAGELKPLDYAAVRNSALPLVVPVTMVDTQRAELARDFTSNQDLKEAIVASCWLPFANLGTAAFRGRPALDGGVLMPSMLEAAENDNCTHVLLLRTVPIGDRHTPRPLFRSVASRYLDRLEPGWVPPTSEPGPACRAVPSGAVRRAPCRWVCCRSTRQCRCTRSIRPSSFARPATRTARCTPCWNRSLSKTSSVGWWKWCRDSPSGSRTARPSPLLP